MKKKIDIEDLIDINIRKGIPRFHRLYRPFQGIMAAISLMIVVLMLYIVFTKINLGTPILLKIMSMAALFLGLQSVISNLLVLYGLGFAEDALRFRYVGQPGKTILWKDMIRIDFTRSRKDFIKLTWRKNGKETVHRFFTPMDDLLEIVNAIYQMAPHIEHDEFISYMLVKDPETARQNLKKTNPVESVQ